MPLQVQHQSDSCSSHPETGQHQHSHLVPTSCSATPSFISPEALQPQLLPMAAMMAPPPLPPVYIQALPPGLCPSTVAMGVPVPPSYTVMPAPRVVAVPPPLLPGDAPPSTLAPLSDAVPAEDVAPDAPVVAAASEPAHSTDPAGSLLPAQGSDPVARRPSGDSLKVANEFFAGLLRTMQANSSNDHRPCEEAAASGDHLAVAQDGEGDHSAQEDPSQRTAPSSKSSFDPDLARQLFRERWQLAVADINKGLGCRHTSAVH